VKLKKLPKKQKKKNNKSVFESAVYVETQTPAKNANGLVSIEIGSGTIVTGDFSSIIWANGPY
jgi:hypothetical protein